jgi:hypothetical protein
MGDKRKRPGGKIRLTFGGRTLTVAEWSSELHFSADVIYARVRKGWPAERVLTTVVKHGGSRRSPRMLTHENRTQDVRAWARDIGLSFRTLRRRLATWPVEKALTQPRFARHLFVFQNRAQTLRDWAREMGVPIKRLERRLRLGWSLEKALTTKRIRPGTRAGGGRRFVGPPPVRRGIGGRPGRPGLRDGPP